jgi:hypothetical protein
MRFRECEYPYPNQYEHEYPYPNQYEHEHADAHGDGLDHSLGQFHECRYWAEY